MKAIALSLFDLTYALSVLVIVCGLPAAGAYLLMRWLSGPYAVAALPLAVCLVLLGAREWMLWLTRTARLRCPQGKRQEAGR